MPFESQLKSLLEEVAHYAALVVQTIFQSFCFDLESNIEYIHPHILYRLHLSFTTRIAT